MCLHPAASGQEAPAPAGAEDAIVSILDASGVPVAAVPVSDGSILKVAPSYLPILVSPILGYASSRYVAGW